MTKLILQKYHVRQITVIMTKLIIQNYQVSMAQQGGRDSAL